MINENPGDILKLRLNGSGIMSRLFKRRILNARKESAMADNTKAIELTCKLEAESLDKYRELLPEKVENR